MRKSLVLRPVAVLLCAYNLLPGGRTAAADPQEARMTSTRPADSQPRANRLARATSPYLQQHAHNPVDWYEWGPEALARARREDKPIFLSIGYSACHWCHVMAHESFENADLAEVMNRLFVNVKVDREERPDLDDIYMQATMMFNRGQGGWPMSVWLTPDLKPFLAGTYFPPESRYGRPGFKELCERIGDAWQTRRQEVTRSADEAARMLSEHLTSRAPGGAIDSQQPPPPLGFELLNQTAHVYLRAFDAQRGGVLSGGSNKFPPSMALDLMLRYVARTGGPMEAVARDMHDEKLHEQRQVLERVTLTLDRMAAGGIYDHLAGGFHRYSTDPDWLVPHFEKMLYDQALISRAYLDAWQYTHNPHYARVAGEIFDYVIADLQSPEGGFYSTRDADSEGEEGRYYVWTRAEITEALGDDAVLFSSYYDISESGNWSDPHAPGVAKNILHAPRDLDTVARLHRVEVGAVREKLAAGRRKLAQLRARRVAPHRDEKILAEWNGMMISALARGGAALDQPRYIAAAARAADFVLARQWKDGRLLRSYRDGRTLDTAFLTDYALMIEGLIELYEATFERRWLESASRLSGVLDRQFWDDADGGYFFAAHDHEALIARPKDIRDGATPSGNSVQLMNLLRLSALLGDDALRARADRAICTFAADVAAAPGSSDRFLAGVEFSLTGATEIAIIGDPDEPRTKALLRAVREAYLPNRIIMLANPKRPADAVNTPLLRDRGLVDDRPTAYVCRNYACKQPVTTADALRQQLVQR